MTYYDAWIEEPTSAELEQLEQSPSEAGPFERSPLFPEGRDAFFLLRDEVASGALRGFQVDWGSYAAFMNRAAIEAFLAKTHGPPSAYEASHEAHGLSHIADKMRALREFVARLPEGRWFKVVVEEF